MRLENPSDNAWDTSRNLINEIIRVLILIMKFE